MGQTGQTGRHRSSYQNFPFLTSEEFTEVCHHLDNKYCQATLGALRKRWKLCVYSVLESISMAGYPLERVTVLQIIRPLEDNSRLSDLESGLENFSLQNEDADEDDDDLMELEESDQEELRKEPPAGPNFGYVKYEIHLHPTYMAPCLWFSLHELPNGEPAFDIETVFRRLVPDQFKDALRGAGPIGGISADNHPLTGVPAFFVHPCLLGNAMAAFDCAKGDYLMLWLGLVGGCVGLWVPGEMALVGHT